jgi:FSR family fosmidomycin resistance protein-like MFS transporter
VPEDLGKTAGMIFLLYRSKPFYAPVTNLLFLFIEFLDELVFGVTDAAWPLIRADLNLSYIQIGVALSLPGIIGNLVEPFLGVLGDVWKRRALILSGGIFFAAACLLTGISRNFTLLLISFILFNPSSGAFVTLSQATLMDSDPTRHEQNMARWTFAGQVGVVLGPLLLGGAALIGFGWRGIFFLLAGLAVFLLVGAWRILPFPGANHPPVPQFSSLWGGLKAALNALKRGPVLRWLVLLEFSDLMLDVLYGYMALYFVDVAGFSASKAALGVAIWTGFGLLGDFLVISVLEKVKGLDYMRSSVIIELILFPAFLLVPNPWMKLAIAGVMGLFHAGWYAILQGNLYSVMPGQSGSVMAVGDIVGLFGKLIPFGIGLAAQALGLGPAMWILLAGPVALLIGLPRHTSFKDKEMV